MVLLLIIFFIYLYGLILSQLTTCIIKFFFSQSCLSFEFSLQIVAMPIWFKMVFLKLKIKLCYQINAWLYNLLLQPSIFFSNIWWLVKIHIQNAWHKAAKFFTCLTCLMPIWPQKLYRYFFLNATTVTFFILSISSLKKILKSKLQIIWCRISYPNI